MTLIIINRNGRVSTHEYRTKAEAREVAERWAEQMGMELVEDREGDFYLSETED